MVDDNAEGFWCPNVLFLCRKYYVVSVYHKDLFLWYISLSENRLNTLPVFASIEKLAV